METPYELYDHKKSPKEVPYHMERPSDFYRGSSIGEWQSHFHGPAIELPWSSSMRSPWFFLRHVPRQKYLVLAEKFSE